MAQSFNKQENTRKLLFGYYRVSFCKRLKLCNISKCIELRCLQLLLSAVAIVFFVQCKKEDDGQTVYLDNEIKLKATELKSEVIDTCYQFIHAKDFFVYHDSILVILNKPHQDGNFVELYNLNSNKLVKSLIKTGNGPHEMINTIAHIRNNELIVHDFAKNQIASVDLDSALAFPDYKFPALIKFSNNVGSPFVTFLDENRLIMLNPYYFKNKNLGINNGASRFIINEKDIDPNFNRVNSRLYYTYNVSQGFIVPNIEKDRIIYASNFYDEIEIYDCDLHLLRRIEGPDNLIPSYQIHNREIIFNKTVPYTYRNYAITDDFFYLSYIGDYYTSGSQLQDFESWILKFDWDGNFIECYHSEEYVSTISLSDTDGEFYARGLDQKGVPVVLELIKTL